jgi:hypothetical protein
MGENMLMNGNPMKMMTDAGEGNLQKAEAKTPRKMMTDVFDDDDGPTWAMMMHVDERNDQKAEASMLSHDDSTVVMMRTKTTMMMVMRTMMKRRMRKIKLMRKIVYYVEGPVAVTTSTLPFRFLRHLRFSLELPPGCCSP